MEILIERLKQELKHLDRVVPTDHHGVVVDHYEKGFDEYLEHEIEALWFWGIERITNKSLKESLIEYYRHIVPWQFFVESVSASGKYHPPHHNRKGGIVRHLTECCILAPRLLRMYGFVNKQSEKQEVFPEALDIVIAATLLTDTFKNGCPWGAKTLPEHGEVAMLKWLSVAIQCKVPYQFIKQVSDAVYWHYGRFTPSLEQKELLDLAPLTQIVHLLDAISSSSEIKLLYNAVLRIDIPTKESPQLD